jgi:hypothetical protein
MPSLDLNKLRLVAECDNLQVELHRLGGDEAVAAVEELCRREQPPKPFPLSPAKRREFLLAALRVARDEQRTRRIRPTPRKSATSPPAQPAAPAPPTHAELWLQFNAERDPIKRGQLWLAWKKAIGAR